jgi:hypothetical protein
MINLTPLDLCRSHFPKGLHTTPSSISLNVASKVDPGKFMGCEQYATWPPCQWGSSGGHALCMGDVSKVL